MKTLLTISVLLLSGCASIEKIGDVETMSIYQVKDCTVFAIKNAPDRDHQANTNYFFSCPQK